MNARVVIADDIKASINRGLHACALVNPRIPGEFYSDELFISSKHTRFKDELDYKEKFPEVFANGDYFVGLPDGACLQIMYKFSKKNKTTYLENSSLSYLPLVDNDQIKNEYIRFDYSSDAGTSSFFHACAHLHIGFKNAIRIPTKETMLLSEFIMMILYLYYPKEYESYTKTSPTYTRDDKHEGRHTKKEVLATELKTVFFLSWLQNQV